MAEREKERKACVVVMKSSAVCLSYDVLGGEGVDIVRGGRGGGGKGEGVWERD